MTNNSIFKYLFKYDSYSDSIKVRQVEDKLYYFLRNREDVFFFNYIPFHPYYSGCKNKYIMYLDPISDFLNIYIFDLDDLLKYCAVNNFFYFAIHFEYDFRINFYFYKDYYFDKSLYSSYELSNFSFEYSNYGFTIVLLYDGLKFEFYLKNNNSTSTVLTDRINQLETKLDNLDVNCDFTAVTDQINQLEVKLNSLDINSTSTSSFSNSIFKTDFSNLIFIDIPDSDGSYSNCNTYFFDMFLRLPIQIKDSIILEPLLTSNLFKGRYYNHRAIVSDDFIFSIDFIDFIDNSYTVKFFSKDGFESDVYTIDCDSSKSFLITLGSYCFYFYHSVDGYVRCSHFSKSFLSYYYPYDYLVPDAFSFHPYYLKDLTISHFIQYQNSVFSNILNNLSAQNIGSTIDFTAVTDRINQLETTVVDNSNTLSTKINNLDFDCDFTAVTDRINQLETNITNSSSQIFTKLDNLDVSVDFTAVTDRINQLETNIKTDISSNQYSLRSFINNFNSVTNGYRVCDCVHKTLTYPDGFLDNFIYSYRLPIFRDDIASSSRYYDILSRTCVDESRDSDYLGHKIYLPNRSYIELFGFKYNVKSSSCGLVSSSNYASISKFVCHFYDSYTDSYTSVETDSSVIFNPHIGLFLYIGSISLYFHYQSDLKSFRFTTMPKSMAISYFESHIPFDYYFYNTQGLSFLLSLSSNQLSCDNSIIRGFSVSEIPDYIAFIRECNFDDYSTYFYDLPLTTRYSEDSDLLPRNISTDKSYIICEFDLNGAYITIIFERNFSLHKALFEFPSNFQIFRIFSSLGYHTGFDSDGYITFDSKGVFLLIKDGQNVTNSDYLYIYYDSSISKFRATSFPGWFHGAFPDSSIPYDFYYYYISLSRNNFLSTNISKLQTDLSDNFTDLQTNLQTNFIDLQTNLQTNFTDLQTDISDLSINLSENFTNFQSDISDYFTPMLDENDPFSLINLPYKITDLLQEHFMFEEYLIDCETGFISKPNDSNFTPVQLSLTGETDFMEVQSDVNFSFPFITFDSLFNIKFKHLDYMLKYTFRFNFFHISFKFSCGQVFDFNMFENFISDHISLCNPFREFSLPSLQDFDYTYSKYGRDLIFTFDSKDLRLDIYNYGCGSKVDVKSLDGVNSLYKDGDVVKVDHQGNNWVVESSFMSYFGNNMNTVMYKLNKNGKTIFAPEHFIHPAKGGDDKTRFFN